MVHSPPRSLQFALGGALFMQGLDSTAIVPALPQIAASFGAPELASHILLAAYFIGCGASLPVIGWAVDHYGGKTVLLWAITVFVVAALASAVAPNLPVLTVSRFVQGAAAATLMPVARMLAVRTASPRSLLGIITALTAPAMAGQTLGPALGGLLVAHDHWRAIFLIGIPFAAASLAIVTWLAPDIRNPREKRLDWIGVMMGAGAMAAAVVGLATARADGPPPMLSLAFIVLTIGLGRAFVLRNLKQDQPLIDFRVVHDATFRRCLCGGMWFRLMVGAAPFLLAYHFTSVLNLGPVESGLLITASGAGALMVKPFTAGLLASGGYRNTLLWAGIISVILFMVPAVSSAHWPLTAIAAVLVVGSFVRSLQITTFSTLCYADLPARSAGSASVLSSIGQQLAHALGVALAAGAMSGAAASGATGGGVTMAGFLIIGLGSALCLPVFLRLDRKSGSNLL